MSIQPVPDALAGEKTICVDFLNLENGATVFMVTGALSGQQIHVLLDTGAGLSFISKDIVEQLKLKTKTVPAINIRLGNGSVECVNEVVTTEVHLNNLPIPITAYMMPLPSGIQFIIGMPTMVELDLWLHPASKRIKILQDQKDVTLNYMASPELISEFQTRSVPRAGLYHMSATGDAVDGAGIANTACGNEIEYMTDKKAFSKLLATYEQGKLDWSTYTDPSIRGKHCTYAGAIAKDRESYVTEETVAAQCMPTALPTAAAVICTNDASEVLLTRKSGGVYTLPQADITAVSKDKSARRPEQRRQAVLAKAAFFAMAKVMNEPVKLQVSHTAPNNVQVFSVVKAKSQVLDSEVDGQYFNMENLPAGVSDSDRTVIKSHFDMQYDPQSMAFLAQLFINPNLDDVAGDAAVELEKDLFKPTRKRLTPAGANQIFDMLCRQTDLKENRKVERRRRSTLRKSGSSVLYKPCSGGNSGGLKCRIYARKHIKQVDREYTAGSIKFGKNAKVCHFTVKSKIIGDSNANLVDTCFDEKSSTPKSKSDRKILDLMTAHAVNPAAAIDLVQQYVPLREVQENIADMEKLRHMCLRMTKAKFDDKAELPEMDSKTVEEYCLEHYPIDLKEIDQTVEEQKEWVRKLQEGQFGHFSCFDDVEKFVHHPEHTKIHFDLIPGKTPRKPYRHRCPVHLLEELKKFHVDMYRRGFIKPITDANHLSPVLIVRKPDNADGSSRGYRFVVSMVEINECLQKCNNQLPLGEEMFDRLKDAKRISCFDLKTGYWLAELDTTTQRLCAFQSEFGAWAYRVLPMGASPSAGIYSEWVTRIYRRYNVLVGREVFSSLDEEYEKQVNAGSDVSLNREDQRTTISSIPEKLRYKGDGFLDTFLDDAIVSSLTDEEHRAHILLFLTINSRENLPLQFPKCTWFTKYTRFLGIVVGSGLLMTDPLKVRAIMKMVRPKSAAELKSFIGAAGWMRRWIPSFAARQYKLNQLMKKGVNFAKEWTEEHTAAWLDIKKALMTYPTLRCFNPDKECFVYTDSSQFHCGGCLIQFYDELDEAGRPTGKKNPCAVAYHSRSFIPAETKYSSQEREMLGVLSCCMCFKHYLLCSRFTVRCVSDHQSLQYCKLNKIEANRVSRWTMKMSQFNYLIEYAKGSTHFLADELSRAVELPSEAWTPRIPIDNDDDFLSTPFMMFWPGVFHGYRIAALSGEVKLDGGGESTCATTIASSSKSKSTAQVDEYHTGYDDSLDDPDQYMFPHEKFLFGYMSSRPVPQELLFKESDYLRCKDFGQIYNELVNSAPTPYDGQARTDDADAESLVESEKAKRRVLLTKIDGNAKIHTRYQSKADLAQAVKHYFIDGGYLYKQDSLHGAVLCVPDGSCASGEFSPVKGDVSGKVPLRRLMFNEIHCQPCGGHRGIASTELALRKRYHWPHMCDTAVQKNGYRHDDSVREMIRRCPICNMSKIDRTKPQGLVQPVQTPRAPAQSYNVDLIVGLPKIDTTEGDYSKILVAIDRFSTRTFLIPCLTNVTASLLGEQFVDTICLEAGRGLPIELVSDRDPLFTSGLWQSMFNRFGTVLHFTTARNQQANGKAERQIAVIEELLRMNISFNQRNWLELLPHIAYVLNATFKNNMSGMSAMMAEMGIQPLMPIDIQQRLRPKYVEKYNYRGKGNPQTAAERIDSLTNLREQLYEVLVNVKDRMVDDGDRRRRTIDSLLKPGAKAWIRTEGLYFDEFNKLGSRKLKHQWYGPFEILDRVSVNSFKLDIGEAAIGRGTHDVFPVRVLRAYVHDDTSPPVKTKTTLSDEEDETDYEIDQILAVRVQRGEYEYLVSWKGYSARLSSSWLDEADLTPNAAKILAEFTAKAEMPPLPVKPPQKRRKR